MGRGYLFMNKHVLSGKGSSGTVLSTDEVLKEQIGPTNKWKKLIRTFRETFGDLLDSSHLKESLSTSRGSNYSAPHS